MAINHLIKGASGPGSGEHCELYAANGALASRSAIYRTASAHPKSSATHC
jgi:hypothetical protein